MPTPTSAPPPTISLQMLTPIIKAYFTDMGSEVRQPRSTGLRTATATSARTASSSSCATRASPALRGHQRHQALDLVGLKLPMKGSQAAQRLLGEMSAFVAANKANDKMKGVRRAAREERWAASGRGAFLMQNAMKNPDEAGAAATDLLRLMSSPPWPSCGTASPSPPTRAWRRATTMPSTRPKLGTASASTSPACCRQTTSAQPPDQGPGASA
jgi:hypothetical protein